MQLAAIVDWVAYGAAGNGLAGVGEGDTSVNQGVPIVPSQGAVRKNTGCKDSNNNAADFVVVDTPMPHNTSSGFVPCIPNVVSQHVLDYDGDGKTDFAVVRNAQGTSGQSTWFISSEPGVTSTAWGLIGDKYVSGDFDGDNKSDIIVWRPDIAGSAAFYVLLSGSNTLLAIQFGENGDDPTVVGDYTGDGKSDPAVYRTAMVAERQSYFFYLASSGPYAGGVVWEPWGSIGDRPVPGDFDGDGKNDFVIARDGVNTAIYWQRLNGSGIVTSFNFGVPSDLIVPGDYDGDGKADLMAVRTRSGSFDWYLRTTGDPSKNYGLFATFGSAELGDLPAPGDYDEDGKTDVAIWRRDSGTGLSGYYVRSSVNGNTTFTPFGLVNDYPLAHFQSH